MKLILLVFVLLMIGISYLLHLNPATVTFYYTAADYVNVSVVTMLLISMSAGASAVLLVGGIGEFGRMVSSWRNTRQRNKEKKVNSLYVNAVNAFTAGRAKESANYFKKILTIMPGHINSMVRLGNLLRNEGDYAEALRLHRRAKAISNENLEICFAIVSDLESASRDEEAVVALNEILKDKGGNISALRKLREIYIKKEMWEKALEVQSKLIKIDLDDEEEEKEYSRYLEIKYGLAMYNVREGDCEDARKQFKDIIKQEQLLPVYIGMAESFICEGKRRDSAEFLERAYRDTGMLELLIRLEDIYVELGEPEKVIAVYQEETEHDKDSVLKKFLLGRFYFRLEMLDDAMDVLYSISSDINHPGISIMLGSIYVRKGDLNSAAAEFKKLFSFKEDHLFTCGACGFENARWSAECPKCGKWNAITLTPLVQTNSHPLFFPLLKH